jgi:hypothetical protein
MAGFARPDQKIRKLGDATFHGPDLRLILYQQKN